MKYEVVLIGANPLKFTCSRIFPAGGYSEGKLYFGPIDNWRDWIISRSNSNDPIESAMDFVDAILGEGSAFWESKTWDTDKSEFGFHIEAHPSAVFSIDEVPE